MADAASPPTTGSPVAYAFLVVMVVALLFALPVWPHSRGWGWTPTLMVGVILGTTLLFGFAGGIWTLG